VRGVREAAQAQGRRRPMPDPAGSDPGQRLPATRHSVTVTIGSRRRAPPHTNRRFRRIPARLPPASAC
jgi:hypothetical protein